MSVQSLHPRTGAPERAEAQASPGESDDAQAWRELAEAPDPAAFASAWLRILSARLTVLTGFAPVEAMVALGPVDAGPFAPAAIGGSTGRVGAALSQTAERCLAARHGVARAIEGQAICQVGYPILVRQRLYGVVAVELPRNASLDPRRVLREIQWGSSWFSSVLEPADTAKGSELVTPVIDEILKAPSLLSGIEAAVTRLADALGIDRVTIGAAGRGCRVLASSHSATLSRNTDFVRRVEAALDEAADQGNPVVFPLPDTPSEQSGNRLHGALLDAGSKGWCATFPLEGQGGIRHLIQVQDADPESRTKTLALLAPLCGPLASALDSKRLAERGLASHAADLARAAPAFLAGTSHRGLKLAGAAAAVLAVLPFVVQTPLRITAEAELEGAVRRTITVPFDGYLDSGAVRSGDQVRSGDVLGKLDTEQLDLERLDLLGRIAETRRQIAEAGGQRDIAKFNILRAREAQVQAELLLVDGKLSRTVIRAPFDAVVVSGDLSQEIGAPVKEGQTLFELSPLDQYRVAIKVDERDIQEIQEGQTGEIVLNARPADPVGLTVTHLTALASAVDGKTVFRVDGGLDRLPDSLRPGMRGIAKIEVGERSVAEQWSRRILNWLRITTWRWLP
ncbi:multidrug efflux pump subunit AcrA (membrane-fusion protein) [Skermanella aerolata]|uniref:efflux RND transporter periplasmic adaptor subunit n=1 Tax=Skermanella aerolata TaxID=393310 RepID=UPI003D203A39